MFGMRGLTTITALYLFSLSLSVKASATPRFVSCPVPDPPDHVVFFPQEANCTQYYMCDEGAAVLRTCPSGLHWNPKLDVCDWPWNAGCSPGGGGGGGCDGGGSGGNGCPAGTTPTCPNPDPAISQFFPHQNDCRWFYHCSNGVANCKQCPAGLHWNAALNTCDWPWHAGCSGSGGGGDGGNGGGSGGGGDGGNGGDGDGGNGGGNGGGGDGGNGGGSGGANCPVPQPDYPVYFPDPNDCTVFYECSFGVAYKLKCPSGLLFNPIKLVCDFPENSGCTNGGGPTTSGPDVTTAVPKPPLGTCPAATPPSCPATDPGLSVFFPHPNDSHYFYHCSNGVPYCKVCPSGLQWNQAIESCDW